METTRLERYWSFTFWLRKSLWLGMASLATWMLWQYMFRQAEITDEWVLFTNGFLRIVGGLIFAYLVFYFGSRFWLNWRKDASIEHPFTAILDEEVTPNRLVDEPFIQESRDFVAPPPTPPPFATESVEADDLAKIEGIGPAIADVLRNSGISTFSALGASSVTELENILSNAGEHFRFHDPSDWPKQAKKMVDKQWERLNT